MLLNRLTLKRLALTALLSASLALLLANVAESFGQGLGVEVRDEDSRIIGRQGAAGGDLLEPSPLAIPILTTNIALLAMMALRNRRPLFGAHKIIQCLLSFEISKK